VTRAPVLLFDSGLGGLSVLREMRVRMPGRQIVYVADDAAFPYGAWGEAELSAHIRALFRGLVAWRPCLVVVACNTASTLVLADLRADHPGTPFVGTVPAIKPAAERTASGLISVLATPGTVRRAYTEGLIRSFAGHARVQLVGSARLAGMAEASLRGHAVADEEILREIRPCFVEEGGRRTDIVVLACTHYPFLANRFRKLAPWPVDWLDPAEAIVARAASLLPGDAPEGEPRPDLAVFTAGAPDRATCNLIRGFGLRAGSMAGAAAAAVEARRPPASATGVAEPWAD
jgi:glutamate racemase